MIASAALTASPVAATDAAGNVLWKEEYKPFGDRLLSESGSKNNALWYTGKEEEGALGGFSILEKRLSDGRGMRLNQDSTFKGFID